jgi:hypothetical protein
MTDPALFEALLFHASVHLDTRENRPWSLTTLFHRGEAIRLVNERLNSSDDPINDVTIAAIAWTASTGVSSAAWYQ